MKETVQQHPAVQCLTTACNEQWLYIVGDEGVVYSQRQSRFAGLDAAGVAAYQAFDAGLCIDDLQEWRGQSSTAADKRLQTIFDLSRGQFPASQADEAAATHYPLLENRQIANVEILGIRMLIEYPHGAWEILSRDCFRNCHPASGPAFFHINTQQEKDGWIISINGRTFYSCLRDEQIGLGLLHAVRSLLYSQAEYDVAFHGAMVADDQRGILLCAPRESGKSTLGAHLVARQFQLVTDEPALLQLDTALVSPLDMPISLKEGSWDVLHEDWPHLPDALVHVRSDATKIRMLHPPRERKAHSPRRLTHIIFPEYFPSSPTRAEELTPVRTIALLNEGGMLFAAHIDKNKFEQFLQFICATPACLLGYSSLEEARKFILSQC